MPLYGGETTRIEYIDLELQFEIQILPHSSVRPLTPLRSLVLYCSSLPSLRRRSIHSFCDGDFRIVRRVVNHGAQQRIVSGQLIARAR